MCCTLLKSQGVFLLLKQLFFPPPRETINISPSFREASSTSSPPIAPSASCHSGHSLHVEGWV